MQAGIDVGCVHELKGKESLKGGREPAVPTSVLGLYHVVSHNLQKQPSEMSSSIYILFERL